MFGDAPELSQLRDDYAMPFNTVSTPDIDASLTVLNPATGDLAVRYLVDSHPMHSTYPMLIEFYVFSSDGQELAKWIGTDVYPQSEAAQPRDLTFAPIITLTLLLFE